MHFHFVRLAAMMCGVSKNGVVATDIRYEKFQCDSLHDIDAMFNSRILYFVYMLFTTFNRH